VYGYVVKSAIAQLGETLIVIVLPYSTTFGSDVSLMVATSNISL
jgi:hypothetical protein